MENLKINQNGITEILLEDENGRIKEEELEL